MTETVGSQAESQSEPGTMEARCFFVKGRSLPSWKPNPGNKCSPDSKCTRYFLPLTETHMSVCSNRWLKALFSPCSHWNRAFLFLYYQPTAPERRRADLTYDTQKHEERGRGPSAESAEGSEATRKPRAKKRIGGNVSCTRKYQQT